MSVSVLTIHLLDACLPLKSGVYSPGYLQVRGPVLRVSNSICTVADCQQVMKHRLVGRCRVQPVHVLLTQDEAQGPTPLEKKEKKRLCLSASI